MLGVAYFSPSQMLQVAEFLAAQGARPPPLTFPITVDLTQVNTFAHALQQTSQPAFSSSPAITHPLTTTEGHHGAQGTTPTAVQGTTPHAVQGSTYHPIQGNPNTGNTILSSQPEAPANNEQRQGAIGTEGYHAPQGTPSSQPYENVAPSLGILTCPQLTGLHAPPATSIFSDASGSLTIGQKPKYYRPKTGAEFSAALIERHRMVLTGEWRTDHTAKMDPKVVNGIEKAFPVGGLQWVQQLFILAAKADPERLPIFLNFDFERSLLISQGLIPANESALNIAHPQEPHIYSLAFRLE
jgi:hypothetical protein